MSTNMEVFYVFTFHVTGNKKVIMDNIYQICKSMQKYFDVQVDDYYDIVV